jgi:hypothetical protein
MKLELVLSCVLVEEPIEVWMIGAKRLPIIRLSQLANMSSHRPPLSPVKKHVLLLRKQSAHRRGGLAWLLDAFR